MIGMARSAKHCLNGLLAARARFFAGVATAAIAATSIELAFGLAAGLNRQGGLMIGEWEGNVFIASNTVLTQEVGGRRTERNSISIEDLSALRAALAPGARVAAMSAAYNVALRANGNEGIATVRAVQPDYLEMQHWILVSGHPLSPGDEEQMALRCVIGATVARELFGGSDPLGKRVQLFNSVLTVGGVLAPKGRDSHGEDRDDVILVPYSTGTRRLWSSLGVRSILVTPVPGSSQRAAASRVAAVLRERHHTGLGQRQDFSVLWDAELLRHYRGLYRTKLLIGSILAALAVLAAGVVAAVTSRLAAAQRQREFALKRSLGARRGRVLLEMLGEAAALATFGLLVGSPAAVAISTQVTRYFRTPESNWSALPVNVTPGSILTAGIVLVLCSGVAALGPARGAAFAEPAKVLRA